MDDLQGVQSTPAAITVQVLDGFGVTRHGSRVELPARACRMVGCLAVRPGPVGRSLMAGHLWPDTTERQAAGSLRSTLLTVRRVCPELLDTGPHHLALATGVDVDAVKVHGWCRSVLELATLDPTPPPFHRCPDILPELDDDWVAAERDHLHQLVMHALESVTDRLLRVGRFSEAETAAFCAVLTDPLRESARRALIRVHLAEGNVAEALREYYRFQQLLDYELGVAPSEQLTELVAPALSGLRSS